jgi:hypothetical protein
MSRIPTGQLIWSLRRCTTTGGEDWDRLCACCQQAIPIFEHEHRNEQGRPHFDYLCEGCAQKKLAQWLQGQHGPDYMSFSTVTDFDLATVYYEPKNDGETFTLTRWSAEQRRRRLQQQT